MEQAKRKSKVKVKHIVLPIVAFLLLCIMIAANIVFTMNAKVIHTYFSGNESNKTVLSSSESITVLGDALVQEIAADSMVLLRNENNALPLAKDARVNLFGCNSTDLGFMLTGGGSGGTVIPAERRTSLPKALEAEGMEYNETLLQAYANYQGSYDSDLNASADNRLINPDASFYTDSLINQAKSYSDIAIVTLSRFARENNGGGELLNVGGYNNGTYLELSANERIMMEKVSQNFGTVIVLFNTTNIMECGFLEDYDIDAALFVGLPGQSGARAIPKLLRGDITPSGRTADTYAYDHQTNDPTYANAIYNGSNIHYAEGIYFGYKWYETADVEGYFDDVSNDYGSGYDGVVQYPFGYGLSYTTFDWEVVSVPENTTITDFDDTEYRIQVKVTNTGSAPGKDVVQLYFTPPYYEGGIEKAHVNLLDFVKTDTLYPADYEVPAGADAEDYPNSQIVTLSFKGYDMTSYDAYDKNNNDWTGNELDVGDYQVKLMRNAHEQAACENNTVTFTVPGEAGDEIIYFFDPSVDNGDVIINRFTGDDAYAGVSIDGSNVYNNISYMSRANDFANFPTTQTGGPNNGTAVNSAANYRNPAYDDQEKPTQGSTATDYKLMTREDGSAPSESDLKGESGTALIYNDELCHELADYDDPKWDDLLDQLTEDEIKRLIGDGGFKTSYAVSVGKPNVVDRDGPAGFNKGVTNPDVEADWTAYPVEALTGCCWNTDLLFSMGRAQGMEAANSDETIKGWYAPGVNLHRSHYNTRNFEYYSEDGVLSGKLAANLVYGAKTNNLYCYIKHFAASEAGQNPNDKNTWLTEQALRECYLKPFELAVKEGKGNAIMSCFNRVGAVWAGSNYALSTEVLRGEWGFRGTMITDWYQGGYMDYVRGILAGNDLWLKGNNSGPASFNFNDPGMAYAARQSAKNILYTFVDTYVTAKDYVPGEDDDFQTDVGGITATADPYSPLFSFLWTIINVVLVLGIVACLFFAFGLDLIKAAIGKHKSGNAK